MKKLIIAMVLVGLFYASSAFAAVNINTAGADELAQLSGIGPAKAEAIIQYREEHGDFKSLTGLTQVSGIGGKTLEDLRDEAVVQSEAEE